MPRNEINLDPVTHITTDAIGQPGQRVFYLQGQKDERTVTLIVEKFQVQSLAVGIEQFIAEVQNKFPELSDAPAQYDDVDMTIHPPVDPLFRVGEISLGFDVDRDLALIIAREQVTEDTDVEDADVVRFWCTRSQLRGLASWGLEVASQGRTICPYCGEPEDPEGHFCPKKNGGHANK